MHPGNIPAEPDTPRQDPGGTGQKILQNRSKIWSGRVRGASRIDPGRFRNTPERTKRKKIEKVRSKNRNHVAPERFFANFGVRPGPQNRQKMSPGTKKCVRKRRRKRFLSFFLALSVRSRFPDRFLEGPTLQNPIISAAGARFWQNHRLPKKHRKSSLQGPVFKIKKC